VNGCQSTASQVVTLYPSIDSDFTISDDTICSPTNVTFAATPGGSSYFWDWGDGNNEYAGSVANHTFTNTTQNPVTYTVTLTTLSFYTCPDVTMKDVVVYPTPIASFSANPVVQTFPNATVNFTDLTNAGNWTYTWDFGDTSAVSTQQNPSHTYGWPGTYAVTLGVTNGICTDDFTSGIEILPIPPVAAFDSLQSGCTPWTVTMNNTSLYASSYVWDFGDGSPPSTDENPTHTFYNAGTYVVRLTAIGPGGTDQAQRIVSAYQTPSPYFTFAPTFVYVDDEAVKVFNLSQDADTYLWEFGDGETSTEFEPYHVYMEEGEYYIILTAYTDEGCEQTYETPQPVTVEPAGTVQFATAFRPNKDGPTGGAIPTSGSERNTVFFPPVKEKVDEYLLQIFNRWGELIFESDDINIGWDGYYKGSLCKQDVYVWRVEGKYSNGKRFKKAGDITLLH